MLHTERILSWKKLWMGLLGFRVIPSKIHGKPTKFLRKVFGQRTIRLDLKKQTVQIEKRYLGSQVSIIWKQAEKVTLLQIRAISSGKGKMTQWEKLGIQRADQEPRRTMD